MSQIDLLTQKVIEEKIILHGSPRKFYELRPTRRIEDDCCMCATQFPEIAILMAILRKCKGHGGVKYKSITTENEPVLHLRMSAVKLNSLLSSDELTGYIYVLDRDNFQRHSLNELRCWDSRFVRAPISVTKADLPFIPEEGKREYHIPLSMDIITSFPIREYFP